MVILVIFKGFLLVKNLEILIKIVPDHSIYSYYCVHYSLSKTTSFAGNSMPIKPLNMSLGQEYPILVKNLV